MFDIAKESVDTERIMAFSPDLVEIVYGLFPDDIQMDFAEFDDRDSKNKLSSVFDYIGTMRKKNQVLLKSAPGNTGGQGGAGGYRHGNGYGQGGGGRKFFDPVPTTAVKYDPAQRDVKCRICVTLEGEGETDGIYDDHYHSVASGCPKFAAMPRDSKLK